MNAAQSRVSNISLQKLNKSDFLLLSKVFFAEIESKYL